MSTRSENRRLLRHASFLAPWIFALLAPAPLTRADSTPSPSAVIRFPADRATEVNPDTPLVLTFPSAPTLGTSGQIRIYDADDDRLVDLLDLSIPPGPTTKADRAALSAPYTPTPYAYFPGRRLTNANTKPGTPSGVAVPTPDTHQLTIIGGFTDGFHFYPVLLRGHTATITLHHNLLDHGKTYYVQIDPGVLTTADGGFNGIAGKTGWTFTTKKSPPPADAARLVVSADGTGDFNTVQGAVDFIPDLNPRHVTVFIRNGTYEEIVYFRNKTRITFLGEDREKTVVTYHNCEIFNPHPANVSTNELPGTFPSRRAVFMADNCSDIHLVNLTVRSTGKPQAEGLLLMGERNLVSHVTIIGSGDALQVNGSAYLADSSITGTGDIVLSRGPAFFERCTLEATGTFLWVRNTAANHGNVFLRCRFQTRGDAVTEIARAPANRGKTYPHAEAVLLHCALAGVSPAGWGPVGGDTSAIRYWEFNSTNLADGTPADVSQRHPVSRRLNAGTDAELIASYSNPAHVLGGWSPALAPVILTQPAPTTVAAGQTAVFRAGVAAVPAATYQWFKDGALLAGATEAELKIEKVRAADAGAYTVTASNASGRATSAPARLGVE